MAAHNSTVLVADDTRATATALAELLANAGLRVEIATDGAEALRRALEPQMDLVLLDLALPELDGLQVLRMLRARPDKRHLPVIVLTVSQDAHARLTALQLGADDVLHKPWDTEILLARIRRCLELKHALAPIEAPRSGVDPVTALLDGPALEQKLKEEFRRAQRYADPLGLVLLEVESPRGLQEAVLRDVGQALRRAVRETDVLGHRGEGAFAALLPKTSLAGGLTAAERMLAQLKAARRESAGVLKVSLGVAGYPHRTVAKAEQLWASANEALQLAKRQGGDRIRLFSQALARHEGDAEQPGDLSRF